MNTTVKWVASLSLLLLVSVFSTPVFAKPACPGHASCKDGPVLLSAGDDIWPYNVDNDGDDTVSGGGGNDLIQGGLGNDDLQGDEGDDWLAGEDGDDLLEGGDGEDTILGGGGNDALLVSGSGGVDFLDGGPGYDSLHLESLDHVFVRFEEMDNGESWGFYRGSMAQKKGDDVVVYGHFRGVELVRGSVLSGYYHGNEASNQIWGNEGDDEIFGHGGDDFLVGGGTRRNSGGQANDYIDGGAGNDTIMGLLGDDYIVGGPGDDDILIGDDEGNDVVEDFEQGDFLRRGDRIVIYNSGVCWPDLEVTTIDADTDGLYDDTLVAWSVRNFHASITLLDFAAVDLSADDFDFEEDRPGDAGCN